MRDCFLPPYRIKAFLTERRNYLLGTHFRQYLADPPAFTIETDGEAAVHTTGSSISLRGTAPYEVDELYLGRGDAEPNGPEDVRWLNNITWELAVDLEEGPNPLRLLAYDRYGQWVGEAAVLVLCDPSHFVRGDADGNGELDISDSIFSLLHLFAGRAAPDCVKAADVNGDGIVDISDITYELRFLFLGGPAPESPFPACGPDPTSDELTCESFPVCEAR
jgi:hypothetical protein